MSKKEKYRQLTIMDVIRQFDERSYTVKSLFAGAGGLDCGFRQAGLNVVESYEFEKNVPPPYSRLKARSSCLSGKKRGIRRHIFSTHNTRIPPPL